MNPLTAALLSMRRSPYQTMAAILIMSVTFFVGYILSLFFLGAERILRHFETQPQIIGFFQLGTTPETIIELDTQFKQKPYVASTRVITQTQALELYQSDNKDEPLLLELVTADILPASIEVSGRNLADLAQIKQDLEQQPVIEEVVYREDLVDVITKWTNSLRRGGVGSMVILSLSAILTSIVVVSMKVSHKRYAIQIMRVLGATRWYVTAPFLYEGALYGLFGSLLGWAGATTLLLYLTPWLQDFLAEISLVPVPWQILAIQLGIGTAIAIVAGMLIGSSVVRRIIKY